MINVFPTYHRSCCRTPLTAHVGGHQGDSWKPFGENTVGAPARERKKRWAEISRSVPQKNVWASHPPSKPSCTGQRQVGNTHLEEASHFTVPLHVAAHPSRPLEGHVRGRLVGTRPLLWSIFHTADDVSVLTPREDSDQSACATHCEQRLELWEQKYFKGVQKKR